MDDLDPKLQAALKDLSGNLKRGGYAPDERDAIVEGAAEHVAAYAQAHPDAPVEDMLALISDFADPQLAPEDAGAGQADQSYGRYAWIVLAVTMLGIAALAPFVATFGGDGGTVMALFALIGLPLAGALAFFGRSARLARSAGFVTVGLAVIVLLLGVVFG